MHDNIVINLRYRAEQCRRLAATFVFHDDPAKIAIDQLAKEYDAQADALDAEAHQTSSRPGSAASTAAEASAAAS